MRRMSTCSVPCATRKSAAQPARSPRRLYREEGSASTACSRASAGPVPAIAMRGTQRSRQAASLRNIVDHAGSSARSTNAAQLDATTNRRSTWSTMPAPAHSARRKAEPSTADLSRGQTASACATVIPIESPSSIARGQHSMSRAVRSDRAGRTPSTTTEGHDASSCRRSRPDARPWSCSRGGLALETLDRRRRWSARQSATRAASSGHRGK